MLSDCIKCWNTPCSCGWDYRLSTLDYLLSMSAIFTKAIQFKMENPDVKFSTCSKKETEGDRRFMSFIRKEARGD